MGKVQVLAYLRFIHTHDNNNNLKLIYRLHQIIIIIKKMSYNKDVFT